MAQNEEIKPNWKGPKTLMSVSLQILAAMTKTLFLKGRLGTRLCIQ